MSRVGKLPIVIPAEVTVTIDGLNIAVKGPKGELRATIHPAVRLNLADGALTVSVINPQDHNERALWGLWRNLIRNMVEGVTKGFSKSLEFIGVGYKVAVSGDSVNMSVGFSHPVTVKLPAGVTGTVEKNTLTLQGSDKQAVGEIAASIRRIRKPEPYKGKGIKYTDEVIRRKAGKAAKAVGK